MTIGENAVAYVLIDRSRRNWYPCSPTRPILSPMAISYCIPTHPQTLPKLRQSIAYRRARNAAEGENEPDDREEAEPLNIAVQHHACLGGVCEGNHIVRRLGGASARREACGSEAQGEVGSDPRGSSQPRRRHHTTPYSPSSTTTSHAARLMSSLSQDTAIAVSLHQRLRCDWQRRSCC